MPRARLKADRLRQVFNWLQQEFPCSMPVKLSLVPQRTQEQKEHFGWVDNVDGTLVVYLVKTHALDTLIESLIHEYAHCKYYPKGSYHKSKVWKNTYGEIYHRFYDCRGWEDSHHVEY